MQQYSVVHALYLSFFSRALYRDVAVRWKGVCLVYLLGVLALCTIPGTLRMQADLGAWLNDQAAGYIRQLPDITITKGVLSVDAEEPYRILDPTTGEPVVILDSTGSVKSLEGTKAVALFTKTALIVRKNETETRAFSLSDLGGETMTIGRRNAYDLLEAFVDIFPVILYPFALFISLLLWSTVVLVFALAGRLYARRLALALDGRSVVRIAVIALTPALLSGALMTTAGASLPYWWLVTVLISLAYMFYGIQANVSLPTQESSDEKDTDRR
ncbi:MAG: hypothetical protein C0402_11830 [Thermodesulfovibrio sp.]|nr:hypothetical protein [Thermodesulfovibrio sp.]